MTKKIFCALKKEKNIFSRLYRYRPKSAHESRENFLREAFVLLLSSDEDLLKNFLKNYLKLEVPRNLVLDSDQPYQNVFFDICITDNISFYTIIECKLGSEIPLKRGGDNDNEDQIDKYARLLIEMPFKNKGILYISRREPIKRRYDSIDFNSIRWKDVKEFLEREELSNGISDFLRTQFIEFLASHKVDVTVGENGRLMWKCELCGKETRGIGVYSHQQKHCREFSYVIRNENEKIINTFELSLEPHKLSIEKVIKEVKTLNKIEMSNYQESKIIFGILKENLPQKLWLYVSEQIKFIFSNNAYYRFCEEIRSQIQKQGIEPISYPNLIGCSYENIMKYKNKYLN